MCSYCSCCPLPLHKELLCRLSEVSTPTCIGGPPPHNVTSMLVRSTDGWRRTRRRRPVTTLEAYNVTTTFSKMLVCEAYCIVHSIVPLETRGSGPVFMFSPSVCRPLNSIGSAQESNLLGRIGLFNMFMQRQRRHVFLVPACDY